MQENRKEFDNTEHTLVIEGRNAVLEAFRSGKPIDKVFVLDGCQDGPVGSILLWNHENTLQCILYDSIPEITADTE